VAAAALVAIVLVTVAWWGLALYPMEPSAPEWLLRTRMVCFGAAASGLPHAGGWILLIGEPLGMLGTLQVVWGDALRRDLTWLRGRGWGRVLLASLALATVASAAMAAGRVTHLLRNPAGEAIESRVEASGARPAASLLRLIDQRGEVFDLAALRGRRVLVTFAFGHCQTVCPTIVRDLRAARTAAGVLTPIVVVSVDPWRDVPERLPHIASQWQLNADDRVLSGPEAEVVRALEEWGVNIVRDPKTGDVAHPGLVVVVDERGHETARVWGGASGVAQLLRR
jgi:protein SCO1/2